MISMLTAFAVFGFAQEETDLSYADQLLALEQELDSISIFNLLDSVISLELSIANEFNVRFGFTSSVTSAGRDFDINQSGISTGVSYFHKTGVYGDLTGFWNSKVTPNYNPTILSLGYLGNGKGNWSYSFDYEHWFYNPRDSSDHTLTHSLSTSFSYSYKKLNLNLDYSFLFGKTSSHRIIGSAFTSWDLGKWWHFKKVSLLPSASIAIGDGNITTLRITRQQLSQQNIDRIGGIQALAELTEDQRRYLLLLIGRAFRNGQISEQQRNNIRNNIILANSVTEQQLTNLNEIAEQGFQQESFENDTSFGVLNYSFTLPLSLSTDKLSILLSYTYSIPVKLPGEFFEFDPIGYFGLSLSYRISLK